MTDSVTEAQRAAKRVGLIARRDVLGGFMLLDERDGIVGGRISS